MSHFDRAIDVVLKHEGGLVDNVNDPGGVTNYGISMRWANQQMKLHGVTDFDMDGDGDFDADDIRKMPRDRAIALYRKYFWLPEFELLSEYFTAVKMFDTAVNVGPDRCRLLAVYALNACGIVTPETATMTDVCHQMVPAQVFVPAMRASQWGWYNLLINRNAALRDAGKPVVNFAVFRNGWFKRAMS